MSIPKINPNYYAIIPASVRYDNALSSTAKLLYGEIAALCNQEGFCWASNSYFARLYDLKPKHVSELISSLVGQGHITTEVDATSGNVRNIFLTQAIPKNQDRYPEKSGNPIPKNQEHNNKTNNKTNTIAENDSGSANTTEVRKIYQLYLKCFKLPMYEGLSLEQVEKRYKLTPGRREAIVRRLKDAGFNMVAAAIVGYSREPWYLGENDSQWTADLEKFICRSYEKIEEGANKYERQKSSQKTNDPWS